MAFTKIVGAGIHTLSNVHTHNINSSGIITATSFVGPLDGTTGDFSGNVTIDGNLVVNGTTTTLDTNLTEVDKVEVAANNSTVGVAITQSGSGDLLRLYDGTSQVVTVDDEGNVGIGTNTAFTSGAHSGIHQLTVTDNAPSMSLGVSNTDQLYVRRELADGKYTFQSVQSGGNNGVIALQPYGGNVGIASLTPSAKLDIVEATSIAAVKIKSGTNTNQNASLTFSNDNGGGLMHLGVFGSGASTYGANEANDGFISAMQQLSINSQNASGEIRFGIGVPPTTKLSINSAGLVTIPGDLDVDGHTELDNVNIAGITTFSVGPVAANGQFYRGIINSGSQQKIVGGYISGSDTLRLGESMYLTSTGLGIGVASPTQKLDVGGNGKFNKTGNCNVLIGSTNAGGAAIVLDGDSDGNGSGSDYAYIEHDTSGNLNIVATNPGDSSSMIFNTGDGSERLRIDSGGGVQIGTSVATASRVTVYGANDAAAIFQGSSTGTGAANGFLVGNNGGVLGLLWNYENGGIAIATNDVERLRIESGGDVDIKSGVIKLGSGANRRLMYRSGNNDVILEADSGDFYRQDIANSTHEFFTGNVERVRITSGGDFGLGTNNPQSRLEVKDNSSNNYGTTIRLSQGYNSVFSEIASNFGGSMTLNAGQGGGTPVMHFQVNDSEKMRLNSSGYLLIGMTSSSTTTQGMMFRPGQESSIFRNSGYNLLVGGAQSGQRLIDFRHNGSSIGHITKSGTTGIAYNTSSDYRLKENAVAISDGITRLKTLKPYRFNFISDASTTVDGFFAHEVTAVPEAIIGTKDEVDSDNNPVYQGIDQSKLVPLLTAALQEAITKIETLETKVATLEGS
mgnify:CR=1 FL=1